MGGEDRWIEVTPSNYAHEAAGLRLLREILPNTSPYRAWTNFEFMDGQGQWHEIDAAILGRGRLHLIEMKSYAGHLTGTEQTWTRRFSSGRTKTERSPLILTRRKAQRLSSRIKDEARKVAIEHGLDPNKVDRALPWIQECVYLHGDDFTTDLSDLARSSLFGIDGLESVTGLPGISTRVLEPPRDRQPIHEDISVIVGLTMRAITGHRRAERHAGSWTITGQPLAAGDDWQEWEAQHQTTNSKARARIISMPPGTPTQARLARFRAMNREFTLLEGLRHESIVSPIDLPQDTHGNTVIVYPEIEGFTPLDLYLAEHDLTADQQLEVLQQAADALAYAHRNHVAHRGLTPGSVLVKVDDGAVSVKLVDWTWAGKIHQGTATPGTALGSAEQPTQNDVFQAPEDRWAQDADRVAIDMFSLGALAYFLLSGGDAPARDRAELLNRLRQEGGLDLAASGRFVDGALRDLVLKVTSPQATKRTKPITPKDETFGAQEFAGALANHRRSTSDNIPEVDPLNPAQDDVIDDRFDVVKVLGAGSTARGILVRDREADDAERVLKVGIDDGAASRLADEAETLRSVADLAPSLTGVVRLVEGPKQLPRGRTALLLTYCGQQTLADLVRYDSVSENRLKLWGTELLNTLIGLDEAGITHRDIKPSNLGLYREPGRNTQPRLVLFDFSLARASADSIEAGTPPYRDPDLGIGTRRAYDSAAERYSVAVVLYEMATASTPLYGDGRSDPRALTDEPTIEVEDFVAHDFAPTRAQALTEFFRRALARDARKRFDTAAAMREAWTAVFAAKSQDPTPPAAPTTKAKPARPETTSAPLTSLTGITDAMLAVAGTKASGVRRQVVALLLGTHDQSPADPFESYGRLAEILEVTPGRIAQIFTEFSTLWQKNPQLNSTIEKIYGSVIALLESSGGLSTPDLLARELVAGFDDSADRILERRAFGILRIALASGLQSDGARISPVRRQATGSVAMLTLSKQAQALPRELAKAAEKLVDGAESDGRALVSPADATAELRRAAAKVLGDAADQVEVPTHVLLRIAATSSAEIALSARDELHRIPLDPRAALREVLAGASRTETFSVKTLRSRVAARFPHAAPLPTGEPLQTLVEDVLPGTEWNAEKQQFQRKPDPDQFTKVPTYTTRTAVPAQLQSGSELEVLLASSSRDRTFRAIGVPLGDTDRVAEAIAARFGAVHVDVTDVLLSEMRARAAAAEMPWETIVAADSGASTDREGLRGFVSQCVPAIADRVLKAGAPVVLTDLSTLAAYGQLGVLQRWVDVTNPPPHAVWALVPQPEETGGRPGARVDDIALPQSAPEQFVQASDDDVRALISASASSSSEESHR